jgi:transcriptional regulator GlxA family with amidase domain
LAQRCGLGREGFTRAFRRATGRSPARYALERRLARAAELLAGGDEPIEAVAAACGFANRYHFSRAFARILACSPAAYRRQGRL